MTETTLPADQLTLLDDPQSDARSMAILRELPPARLPDSYEAAKLALVNCARIDECKNWADKAAALASYAKQANDSTLRDMATRIQGRAVRREGELLEEIEAAKPGPRPPANSVSSPAPNSGRFAAAEEAGLSRRQTVTAIRVANIPPAEFEAAIESDKPPTVTELARRGTETKRKPLVDLGMRTPEEFAAATGLMAALDGLERYAANADLPLAIAGLNAREAGETKQTVLTLDQWLGGLKESLDGVHAQ